MALSFSLPIAPRNLKFGDSGSCRYIPASAPGGRVVAGRRKTQICEKGGKVGMVKVRAVGVCVVGMICNGREGNRTAIGHDMLSAAAVMLHEKDCPPCSGPSVTFDHL